MFRSQNILIMNLSGDFKNKMANFRSQSHLRLDLML